MKLSANELTSLAARAARGAGAPPGQAADFGRAALCHLASGHETADLQQALAALPKGPMLSFPLLLSRLAETAANAQVTTDIPCGDLPDLLQSYVLARPHAAEAIRQGDHLRLRLDFDRPNRRPNPPRIPVPDSFYRELQDLAARTLVPESAASRLSGAGAGMTDND